MRRPLYVAVGGLCLIFGGAIAAEFSLPISSVAALSGDMPVDGVVTNGDPTSEGVDVQIASILERPLFAPDRRGPPAPKDTGQVAGPAERAAPEIRGRLGGITIGPGKDKQAVFERGEGEKPLVVKEGDDVDGWTVSSIEESKVVLTSTFGQREMQPTFGVSGDALPLRNKLSSQKETDSPANPLVQPPPAARRLPPKTVQPGIGRPPPGMTPRTRKPPSNPAMRR